MDKVYTQIMTIVKKHVNTNDVSVDKKEIVNENLFEAIEKVMIGPERKSRVITDKEKKITAYHEAGHALVSHFLPEPIRFIRCQ